LDNSSRSLTPSSVIRSPESAEMVIGTSTARCSIFCAVTTISVSVSAATAFSFG